MNENYFYCIVVYTNDYEKFWEEGHELTEEIWKGFKKWDEFYEADGKVMDLWAFPMEDVKQHPQLKVKSDPTMIFYIQPKGNTYVDGEEMAPVAKLVDVQINARNIEYMMDAVLNLKQADGKEFAFYNPSHGPYSSLVGYGQIEDAPGGNLLGLLAINPLTYKIYIDKPTWWENILGWLFGGKLPGRDPDGKGGGWWWIIVVVIIVAIGIWWWRKRGGTDININLNNK